MSKVQGSGRNRPRVGCPPRAAPRPGHAPLGKKLPQLIPGERPCAGDAILQVRLAHKKAVAKKLSLALLLEDNCCPLTVLLRSMQRRLGAPKIKGLGITHRAP